MSVSMLAASKCFSGYPPTPMQKYLSERVPG